jgi:hypothetical protein
LNYNTDDGVIKTETRTFILLNNYWDEKWLVHNKYLSPVSSFMESDSALPELLQAYGRTEGKKLFYQALSRDEISPENGKVHKYTHKRAGFHVKRVPCHHGMARPQVADGGEGLQI